MAADWDGTALAQEALVEFEAGPAAAMDVTAGQGQTGTAGEPLVDSLEATAEGVAYGVTFSATVGVGDVSASESSVVADPGAVMADGEEASTITVTVDGVTLDDKSEIVFTAVDGAEATGTGPAGSTSLQEEADQLRVEEVRGLQVRVVAHVVE